MFKKVNVMAVYMWGNRKIRQLFPWLRNKIQWIWISILAIVLKWRRLRPYTQVEEREFGD